MVNYEEMRKKFKAKNPAPDSERKRHSAAVKAIAREYELKKAEIQSKTPAIKHGIGFYSFILIGLLIVGASVLSVSGRGGKARISKAQIQARKSMDALAEALGRYKFHVGDYPSDAEGLQALASITPKKKGWAGPYCRKIVPDPWGAAYVYEVRPEGGHPVLYSKGPDGKAGTTDDIMPKQDLFEKPFRDHSWTNHWLPYQLRGIVVAPDEATKRRVQKEIDSY